MHCLLVIPNNCHLHFWWEIIGFFTSVIITIIHSIMTWYSLPINGCSNQFCKITDSEFDSPSQGKKEMVNNGSMSVYWRCWKSSFGRCELEVLPVLPEGDIVIGRPSLTEAAEVPPVIRSLLVLPVLSPIVEFGFTELVDNPPFTWANTGSGIVNSEISLFRDIYN